MVVGRVLGRVSVVLWVFCLGSRSPRPLDSVAVR